MQANKVFLAGYYGMQNSGDDALLMSSALGAKRFLDAKSIAISSPTRVKLPMLEAFAPQLAEKQSFRGENRARYLWSAAKANQIVFGGGPVSQSTSDINLKRLMMKLAGKGPHMALGVGVGPFDTLRAERACAKFLKECDYVGVRDEESYEIAIALAPNANIEMTFDIAPLLIDYIKDDDVVKHKRSGIGVALCPKERLNGRPQAEQKHLREIASALTVASRNSGEPIFLIDLNGHQELGDASVHRELRAYIPSDVPVFSVSYNTNPLRLLERLKNLRVIIGMRLHASILAFMVETPVISLSDHSECVGWCNQIGVPQEYRFDTHNVEANQLSSALLFGLESGYQRPCLTPDQAYKAARKNFENAIATKRNS